MEMYDIVIIGAGPAGLATAVYSSRSKLKTLYIENWPPAVKLPLPMKLRTTPVLPML